MPDMGYEAIKKVLLQVKEMCKHGRCVACPISKTGEDSGIPFCPLYETEDGVDVCSPADWVIDDWEDSNETD